MYVVLIYAVFAALWILLSDKAVMWLFKDPALITLASTLKGWFFVGVTSLLLYGLMRRWFGGDAAPASIPADFRRLGLPFLLLATAIAVLTGAAIFNEFNQHKKAEIAKLQVIADLKTRQITNWLRERQADADFVQTNDFFAEQYRRWQDSGDKLSGGRLQKRLEQFRQNRGFSAIILLNPKGEKLWAGKKPPLTIAPPLEAAAKLATAERKVQRAGPYRGIAGNVRLDFVAPLTAMPGPAPLVILRLNLADWLFPALQTWPMPSASGETLLFQRDGDQVFFLNELRHRKDTAAKLRIPLTTKNLLSAQVMRGEVSLGSPVEGTDYRGIPAIGVVRAITGTNWFLVAKLDKSELYAEAAQEVAWIGLLGLLMLFMAVAGFYLLQQGQQLALANAVQASQAERLHALNLLAAISDSSNDAIFAKDLEGRYILFNRAASLYFGKQVNEVLDRDDRAIFPAEKAKMLMDFDRRVIAENGIKTQEEVLNTAERKQILLTTKGPLHDDKGKIIGIFGISHDITERIQAERLLRNSEQRFRLFFKLSPVPLAIVNKDGVVAAVNNRFISTFGYTLKDVPTLAEWWLLAYPDPEYRGSVMDAWNAAMQCAMERNINYEPIEARITCKDGKVRTAIISGIIIGGDFLTAFADITELRMALVELQYRNYELERFNRATVGRELEMIALKQQINALSRQLGLEPPYPLSFLDTPQAEPRKGGAQ